MAVTMFESGGASAYGQGGGMAAQLSPPTPNSQQLVFNTAQIDKQALQLANPNASKIAIKLKITGEATQYKAKPVFHFIDANGSSTIEVQRAAGGGTPATSEMVLQYNAAQPTDSDPKALFVSGCQDYASITIMLTAGGGAAAGGGGLGAVSTYTPGGGNAASAYSAGPSMGSAPPMGGGGGGGGAASCYSAGPTMSSQPPPMASGGGAASAYSAGPSMPMGAPAASAYAAPSPARSMQPAAAGVSAYAAPSSGGGGGGYSGGVSRYA